MNREDRRALAAERRQSVAPCVSVGFGSHTIDPSPEGATQWEAASAVTNPYEPPDVFDRQAPQPTDSYGQVKRQRQWRRWLLGFSLAWIAFAILTNTCADNLRYLSSSKWFAYAALIGIGNVACLICLCLSVRRWWHLLCLPIWFLCTVELLILVLHVCILLGVIDPPKRTQSPAPSITDSLRPLGVLSHLTST